MLVASALAAAALGTTLGTFVKTEGQASGLSIMLGMVMALLGGCWYPLELFPQAVQNIVKILPTTWAMQGMLDIVLRGQGLDGDPARGGRAAGLCGGLLRRRHLAFPIRVKPESDECPRHEERPARCTSPWPALSFSSQPSGLTLCLARQLSAVLSAALGRRLLVAA